MLDRHTRQESRLLKPQAIEGLERRLTEQGGLAKPAADQMFRELVETRAIGRELISHINALEEGRAL